MLDAQNRIFLRRFCSISVGRIFSFVIARLGRILRGDPILWLTNQD
jgi:hypothetical protein